MWDSWHWAIYFYTPRPTGTWCVVFLVWVWAHQGSGDGRGWTEFSNGKGRWNDPQLAGYCRQSAIAPQDECLISAWSCRCKRNRTVSTNAIGQVGGGARESLTHLDGLFSFLDADEGRGVGTSVSAPTIVGGKSTMRWIRIDRKGMSHTCSFCCFYVYSYCDHIGQESHVICLLLCNIT